MPRFKFNEGFIPGAYLTKCRKEYQRKHPEMTVDAIATKIDCERTALYKMEKDEYPITQEQMDILSKLYGIELYAIAVTDKTITIQVINNER